MTTLQDIVTAFDNAQALAKKDGKEAVLNAFQEIFKRYPTLQCIAWQQYTPYFMDGDACVFNVYCDDVGLQFEDEDEVTWTYNEPEEPGLHRESMLQDDFDEMLSTISTILSMHDDVFLYTFGDHAEVYVERDGSVTIEHCDHD